MNRFANRLSALLTVALIGSTALAQAEVPPPNMLDLAISPTATSMAIGFEAPKSGLMALGASLSAKTHSLRDDLPPVLVQFEVLEFRLVSGFTKFELPRWIATYYAQCGVLNLDNNEIKVSQVIAVEPAKDAAAADHQAMAADDR
jgi:hypothetical protein